MVRVGMYSEHYSKPNQQPILNIIQVYSMETLTIINPFSILSRREREVLDLMLQGAQIKDISASLELKSNTMCFHRSVAAFRRGGLRSIVINSSRYRRLLKQYYRAHLRHMGFQHTSLRHRTNYLVQPFMLNCMENKSEKEACSLLPKDPPLTL